MFNRKKKKIAQLTETLEAFQDQVRVGNGEIRRLEGQIDDLHEKLEQEREHVTALMQANGQFKRELEEVKYKWGAENEALAADKEHLLKRIDNQARTIAELQKAKTRPECPPDCTKHANPGPGESLCRTCIRYPRAKDKYTPENGKE